MYEIFDKCRRRAVRFMMMKHAERSQSEQSLNLMFAWRLKVHCRITFVHFECNYDGMHSIQVLSVLVGKICTGLPALLLCFQFSWTLPQFSMLFICWFHVINSCISVISNAHYAKETTSCDFSSVSSVIMSAFLTYN